MHHSTTKTRLRMEAVMPELNPGRFVSVSRWQQWLLRATDILLSLGALAVLSPLLLLALPGARLQSESRRGRGGRLFNQWSLVAASGRRGRLLQLLGVGTVPLLANILVGDMAFVGPRPRSLQEPAAAGLPPQHYPRPGIFSLWRLRQLTMIDFGSEDETDLEQIRRQGFGYDLGLLLRNLLASLYGSCSLQIPAGPVLVDTVRVSSLSVAETLQRIADRLNAVGDDCMQLCFVNPHCVNVARRNARYRQAVNTAALVVPDGIGMRIAGNILGQAFRHNVNGTDLFPRLCAQLAASGHRLFLLGGQPGVAEEVVNWIAREYPQLQVAGTSHGYFDAAGEQAVIDSIRASKADVLLVAMGVPQQDLWIAQHGRATGVKLAMGVGGLFDFYSGRIPRAPAWLRELGLEWSYRLYQEPARMWRRYLLGNCSFLLAICLQRWLGCLDVLKLAASETSALPAVTARRAAVIASPLAAADMPLPTEHCSALLPLGDRPLLYRTLETLAGLGCREVDLYASHDLLRLRALVGNGERWGLRIAVQPVRDTADAWSRIAGSELADGESLWINRADHWLPVTELADSTADAIWVHPAADDTTAWSGWACLGRQQLVAAVPTLSLPAADCQRLTAVKRLVSAAPYRFDSPAAMLVAQQRWLQRAGSQFELFASHGPGIRIAASASVDPEAVLVAPVEIGENAVVAAGAQAGPNVVLGEGVQLAAGVSLRDALVADGVCVNGPAEVASAVVTTAGIYSCLHGVWLPAAATGYLTGSVEPEPAAGVPLAERAVALLLLLVGALPALICCIARNRSALWREIYPGLLQVLLGKRGLVGVDDPAAIPESVQLAGWGAQLQQAPKGLISPRKALGLSDPDAAAWADVHWMLHSKLQQRLWLLRAYLRNNKLV